MVAGRESIEVVVAASNKGLLVMVAVESIEDSNESNNHRDADVVVGVVESLEESLMDAVVASLMGEEVMGTWEDMEEVVDTWIRNGGRSCGLLGQGLARPGLV